MIGLGITLPVLPFYIERLALSGGPLRQSIALQVSLLTGVFPLGQLFFAPVWGRWADRLGRKPMLLIGIAGYVLAQVLFGLATSLWLLYGARFFGGILSSATVPISATYVADLTSGDERGRGMAWLGTATSLGFVVGPALGGMLSRRGLHFSARFWHFRIDSFSIPFFAAALLALLALFAAMRWLPESLPGGALRTTNEEGTGDWRTLVRSLRPLLVMTFIGQFALASFEATFALYSQAMFNYGPVQVGAAFVVCGLVMAVFQIGGVGLLGARIDEIYQVGAGFGLMGLSLALLAMARTTLVVLLLVGMLALGMALISPNLAALISKRSGGRRVGESLGVQNSANSLAQVIGPVLGGALFGWRAHAPYPLTGALSLAVALVIALKLRHARNRERFA